MPATGGGVSDGARERYGAGRRSGMTQAAAARSAGISRSVAVELDRDLQRAPNRRIGSGGHGGRSSQYGRIPARSGNGNPWADGHAADDPDPRGLDELCDEARESLADFGLFRRRYLGRGPSPWQEDAAHRVLDLLLGAQESRDREYLVLNAPPGAGKSTLWHDVAVWLICRDRRVRILYGSRTTPQASKYTGRIRRTLQQRGKVWPREEDLRAGLAVVPEGSLVEDYGRFKPLGRSDGDVWQRGGFTVAQVGEQLTDEKEPTVTAFGFDADYLGMRVDLAIWDDLVDLQNVRSAEVNKELQDTWDLVAEPRIDPGGLNVLQGQRLRHNDLYRYNLDKLRARDEEALEELDDEDVTEEDFVAKYHHIIYKAHDEGVCQGLHKRADPAWLPGHRRTEDEPGGCLLEPRRVPWRDLKTLMETHPDVYQVVYQQEDLDPSSQIVHKLWVDGGTDDKGTVFPGCWDEDRALWELPPPEAMSGPKHLALVVDPSPSNWWAAQLWLYVAESEKRYLIAIERRRMDAPEFLDWDRDRNRFVGFLEDWWTRAESIGLSLHHVVVEVNVAQKWLLQYDHAKRWAVLRGVNYTKHTTGVYKLDDDLGIPSVKNLWKTGRIRLPGKPDGSKQHSLLLVNEMLRWTKGDRAKRKADTDDQVMAHWFFEFTLPRLAPPRAAGRATQKRPSWLREGAGSVPAAWHRVFVGTKGA